MSSQIQQDLQRVFQAFCAANAALKFHPAGDNRSSYEIEEAAKLIEWMTSNQRQRVLDEERSADPGL